MGLLKNQIKKLKGSDKLDHLDSVKCGLTKADLLDKPFIEQITTQKYIDIIFTNANDSYVIDVETYDLNSKIRCIQLFDVENKIIHFFAVGSVDSKEKVTHELNKKGIKIKFHIYDKSNACNGILRDQKEFLISGHSGKDISKWKEEKCFAEFMMIFDFFKFLHSKPKTLLGHNLAHFDLGILQMKKTKYKIGNIKFFSYCTGSGQTHKRIFFSYVTKTNEDEGDSYWWRGDKKRHLIIDTLLISFTLGIKAKLHDVSRKANSSFPKKEVDFRIFENKRLTYESVLYACYDVLSIPDVLKYLHSIIKKPTEEYLKIKFAQSQLCPEHIWMKGSGALSESFLHKLLGHSINQDVPDYLTKYFGGYCRCWEKDLSKGDIKYFDLTSAYPFSIAKQNLFDILNGDFEYIENGLFSEHASKYQDLIYSTTFEIRAKEKIPIILEVEKDKNNDRFGIGYLRSFNKDMKVAEMQHQLALTQLQRGETIIVTKTELEISKTINPHIENKFNIVKIIDGFIPTKEIKSNEYLQLYKVRKELKRQRDDANLGFKVLLNSCYGKIAESKGEWFNLATASAVTGFVRSMIIKIIFYIQQVGGTVLYCDTDGLVCKNINETQMRKIQKYANTMNHLPMLYGEQNLKLEDENICAFWGIKRKTYTKVINENGSNKVIIKGQNGNSDIAWRDVAFRLSALTNGCTDARTINRKIQENDLELNAPILKTNENSLKYFKDKLHEIKTEISILHHKLNAKQKNWISFFEKVSHIVKEKNNYGEYLPDDHEASVSYNFYFRKLADHFNLKYNIHDSNMFVELFRKLKARYLDSSDLINLLSEIGNVDLSFYLKGSQYHSEILSKALMDVRREIKNKTFDFEMFCKKIYEKHGNKKMSTIFPTSSKAIITRKYNCRLKASVTYEKGVYYRKIVESWERKTGETAYCGLFFSINRDYTFMEKDSNQFNWILNYENYYRDEDKLPIISARFYNAILNQEIRLDTIRLKMRNSINMFNIDESKRSIVTSNIMSMGSVGVSKRCHDLHSPYKVGIYQLRLPKNLSDGGAIFLTKERKKELQRSSEKKIYSNATLFLTNRIRFEGVIRINKIQMFIRERNAFNIYRFISKMGSFTRRIIKQRLGEQKIIKRKKENDKIFNGIEFDYIPRFTFCTQADVNQEISFNDLRWLHSKSNDLMFRNRSDHNKYGRSTINRFVAIPILDYFHMIGYDKKHSAEQKLKMYEFQDWEKEVIEIEAKEDCRSEIKFKLQRNFYETLSYMFAINCLNQRELAEKLLNIPETKYKRKFIDIEFSSLYRAHIEFNQRKCILMFDCNTSQVYELMLNSKVLNFDPSLESSWEFYIPPKEKQISNSEILEKYRVKWRFETSKRLDVAKNENINLEVVRDF